MEYKLPMLFSLEEAKTLYLNYKDKCKEDTDCPESAVCISDKCYLQMYCSDSTCKRCVNIHRDNDNQIFNNKGDCHGDSECLSNSCINWECEDKRYTCDVGNGEYKCGIDTGKSCTNNDECYEKNCVEGICERYDSTKDNNKTAIIVISIACLIVICICFFQKKKKTEKKNKKGIILKDTTS